MFALNVLVGLLAAATVSASPIAEDAALAARQTQWTCPDIGKSIWTGAPLITAPDAKNSRCCVTGWSYVSGEGREVCCRNDPALLEDPTYKYSLPCNHEFWTSGADKIVTLRTCNLEDPQNTRCSARCDNVPWLYPTPKPCPAKN